MLKILIAQINWFFIFVLNVNILMSLTYTITRPARKWKKRECMTFAHVFGQKMIGIELFSIIAPNVLALKSKKMQKFYSKIHSISS